MPTNPKPYTSSLSSLLSCTTAVPDPIKKRRKKAVAAMGRRQRALLARTLLFLFALNAISFALYFLLHSQTLTPHPKPQRSKTLTLKTQKPWPDLPSFLPWDPPVSVPPLHSCEAYFGNGFTDRVDVLKPHSDDGGFVRCHHSETLRSSICEMGRVRMDPTRILMSAGGEDVASVMGRGEEEEMPRYEPGAFEIEAGPGGNAEVVDGEFIDRYLPRGEIADHTMRKLMGSLRSVGPGELRCSRVRIS